MNWLTQLTSLPADVLKAAGALMGGLVLAASTYVIGRLKEPKVKPAEAGARMALSPRTGTSPTRSLGPGPT